MLNIEKKQDGKNLTVALTGRLDTVTAPELESEDSSEDHEPEGQHEADQRQ